MKLSELKTGERGVIVKVTGHGGFRKRIVRPLSDRKSTYKKRINRRMQAFLGVVDSKNT